MDAVQRANSGHPGMPMGMADIAEVLWNDFLKYNPGNPQWLNRDRFVLSNGHGCMLQYSLLHLTGYDLSIDDIKNFRQLHSKTPGHPEYHCAPGIETTTGPLGQGIANSVGMAIAEKILAAQFNRPNFPIIDHRTYVFCGDGCLMEGISHEACSLAGTFKLGKLILFYDDNKISIDGQVKGWFTDNTPERFAAYHWHVVPDVDGQSADAVKKAILEARAVTDKPSIICCKTTIAYGAPHLAGSAKAHGAPLGKEEVQAARENLHWPYPPFEIPEDIYKAWNHREKGAADESKWNQLFSEYRKEYPQLASELLRRLNKQLPDDWDKKSSVYISECVAKNEDIPTRKSSQNALSAYAKLLPEFLGGSADLTESNLTWVNDAKTFSADQPDGQYIHYGVREFGMSAIMNGMAVHGGFIPFGGTFLVFTDYARNALRLSAMMKIRVIYVLTHDSIGLGEDGPTHQPIEHATILRATPYMSVWRPGDAVETAIAWKFAIEHQDGPTCLLLSRQTVVHQSHTEESLSNIRRGGYILKDCEGTPEAIIIGTGSEVQLAVEAYQQLTSQGRKIRVVSMPSTTEFILQDSNYQETVLPNAVSNRVAVEAAALTTWYQFVGTHGKIVGLNRFGESAPYQAVYKALDITTEHVIRSVLELIGEKS